MKKDLFKDLNEKLAEHSQSSGYGPIVKEENGRMPSDQNSRSESAKLTQQKHSDKNSTSSHTASIHGHSKAGAAGHSPHLGYLAPTNHPKPLAAPQRPKPVVPMAPLRPLGSIKPKV